MIVVILNRIGVCVFNFNKHVIHVRRGVSKLLFCGLLIWSRVQYVSCFATFTADFLVRCSIISASIF